MNEYPIQDPKLYTFLINIDQYLAAKARVVGCKHCGGILHSARYPRKPRAVPLELEIDYSSRFSFCCESCRRRTTPASVRYMGWRVYPASVMVLLSAMEGGVTDRKITALRETLGVARRTLERWRHWWRELFVLTPFWSLAHARFMPIVEHDQLPASMLRRFQGVDIGGRLMYCLLFISPLSVPGVIEQFKGR